jgi:predicted membrane chloride channel (bestrophin family)
MRKFITTPVPFPLIQMTRTLVLFYVFTIPLVLLDDGSADLLVGHCLVVFWLTYGYVYQKKCKLRVCFLLANWEHGSHHFRFLFCSFLGLELVSIKLDDPFGNDDNDFE